MRWLWILFIGSIFWASAKPPCIVTDFYALSWINDPTMRHMELSRWLTTNGDNCSSQDLAGIWNNLAAWAGVADSAELRAKILYYYSRARAREDK